MDNISSQSTRPRVLRRLTVSTSEIIFARSPGLPDGLRPKSTANRYSGGKVKYAVLGLGVLLLSGCASGTHTVEECNSPSATHAQVAAGVFGILSMIDCAVTAIEEPEPFPPTKMDSVVENPRPPQNEAESEMLSAPVMVNPSPNEERNNSPVTKLGPAQPLPASELRVLFTGNTFIARTDTGIGFQVYHRADGVMYGRLTSGRSGGTRDDGTWNVTKKGRYCRQWTTWAEGEKQCFKILRNGEGVLYESTTGSRIRKGSGVIRKGNQQNL